MFIWPNADREEPGAPVGTPDGQYDTSSGDSCWVRQYLQWCEAAAGVSPEAISRPRSGTVRGAHASRIERAIAITRPRGQGTIRTLDGEGMTLLGRHLPIA